MYALPKLTGAPNFRELGGYATPDGRSIRPGRVFRSQGLHALTDSDLDALRALDIRLVCDLRSERERLLHPSRWPQGTSTQRLELDIGADVRANNRTLLDIMRTKPDAQGARSMMMASYSAFPQTFAKPLARIFSHMLSGDADGGLPVLVHCSAGKDRTGFVIAMMLSALGVPREVIFEDYMQTEKSIDRERLIQMTGKAIAALLNFEPDREVLDVIAS
ncbi:MAG: tyrosine-protein phosphatase, partial [Burkholderiales bacterium]